MFETALLALTSFFATVVPPEVAAAFAALTPENTPAERRAMAVKSCLIATGILLLFAIFGEKVLSLFGISLPALRVAGGVLLLLISIDMVFARHSGGTSTTREETAEAEKKNDISVFPMATPLIAGPGAIGATILLMAGTEGDMVLGGVVILSLLAVIFGTFLLMLAALPVQRLLGVTGIQVVARIFGILLAALAMQFILDGLIASQIFDGL